jgi:ABC-type sugar transport system substrate-binding protein
MKKISIRLLCILFAVSILFLGVGRNQAAAETPKDIVSAAYKYSMGGEIRPAVLDDFPRPKKPNKSYTIGVLIPSLTIPHFVAQSYGYFDEAKQLGAKVVMFASEDFSGVEQLRQAEDLLQVPVDAICLVALDPNASSPIVDKANAAGIPVVNVNVLTNNPNIVTQIRSDDTVAGAIQADFQAKALGEKGGKVLMINGVAGASWAIGRSTGFKDRIAEKGYPLTILEEKWMKEDPGSVLQVMDDAIQGYGDDIDAVYSPGEVFGKAVLQALKGAKMTDVIVTSMDPSDDGIALIKDGSFYMMVAQSSVAMGRYGIRAAIMALEGNAKKIYKKIWSPIYTVTKDNVDKFDIVGVSAPPKDWTLPAVGK